MSFHVVIPFEIIASFSDAIQASSKSSDGDNIFPIVQNQLTTVFLVCFILNKNRGVKKIKTQTHTEMMCRVFTWVPEIHQLYVLATKNTCDFLST
jgi:hypothetical protein